MNNDTGASSHQIPICEDYESEFEYDTVVGNKRKLRQDSVTKALFPKLCKPKKQSIYEECGREQSRIERATFLTLDAYTRHKKLINEYVLCYPGTTSKLKRDTTLYKTDHDIIRENHKFLWDDDEEGLTWGQQLAKKYYDRLFKEYCLIDLSRYKEKKVGMRWRTEKELVVGKGQFFCSNLNCNQNENLRSWEVNFAYFEHGGKKNALVKLRLCMDCTGKLNYGYKGEAILREKTCLPVWKKVERSNVERCSEATMAVEGHIPEETEIWKQPVKEEIEQPNEKAFEAYLEDMFL